MTSGPVFVAGLERSGTSLLFALLGSHPDIALTRRTNLWRYIYGQYGDLSHPPNLDRCLTTMQKYKRLVVLDLDFDEIRQSFLNGPPTYPRLFELVGRQVADRQGKIRWGDKSLHTERFADEIMDSYPGARVLHMIRDPRDRFASVQTRWGQRLGGVGAGTAEWVQSVGLAFANMMRHPNAYRIVRYEDLVVAPRSELLSICDFIGAPWFEGVLEMSDAGSFRDGGGNSSYGARPVGEISTDSIGRYRSVLTASQVHFIEAATEAHMQALGYQVDSAAAAGWLRLAGHPVELGRYGAWRAREAIGRRRPGRGVPDYRLVGSDVR